MATDVIEACRYLGIPSDKYIRYSDPNTLNVCYADQVDWSGFVPVEVTHQRQFCLTQNHLSCPVYLRQLAGVQRPGSNGSAQAFLEFFGLREEPFSIVPQSRYRCESQSQKEAHAGLKWLVEQRQGLGVLLGPVGTGKTLLCQSLAAELTADPGHRTALLLTPSHRSEYAFMSDLLDSWQIIPERQRSLRDLEAAAHEFLVDTVLNQRQRAVLIVDEAQTLPRRVLQQVCKLLNWQDEDVQLLQVILAGQPALQGHLKRVPALRDRVVVEFILTAMMLPDVQSVVSGRLRRAGHRGTLFAPSAVQLIYELTGGMPRRVMILCLLSLWMAYQQSKRQITREVVRAVAERAGSGNLSAVWEKDGAQIASDWSERTSQPSPSWLPRVFRRFLAQGAG